MKASRILLGLCCALALAAVLFVTVSLQRERENYTVCREILQGDASALEGLTLHQNAHAMNHLLWELDFPLDGAPTCDFQLGRPESEPYRFDYDQIMLTTPIRQHTSQKYYFRNYACGVDRIVQDLAKTVPVGDELEITVDLRDHFDYYPLGLDINLPGAMLPSHVEYLDPAELAVFYGEYSDLFPLSPDAMAVCRKFGEFFRIPMERPFPVRIHILRESEKHYASSLEILDPTAVYEPQVTSVSTGDQCFFAINNRLNVVFATDENMVLPDSGERAERQYIDTSLIPGGYGLYSFSFHREHQNDQECVTVCMTPEFQTGIAYETLRNVYPLRAEVEVITLVADEAAHQLRMVTMEPDGLWLTVLNLATAEEVQRLFLDGEDAIVVDRSDFLVAKHKSRLSLFARDDDGLYHQQFTVQIPEVDGFESSGELFAYNGNQLAIYCNGWRSQDLITVVDETGVLYQELMSNILKLPLSPLHWENRFISYDSTLIWDP